MARNRPNTGGASAEVISFQNVTKIYTNATVPAVDRVNLHIDKGEFAFVVGPSGAGKSTLMKLMYREEVPTSGNLVVDGKNLSKLRHSDVPYFRRNMGVIFQDFKLLPDRTVFQNVAFALEVTEASRREIIRRVPAALELVGLRHKEKSKPMELSGGEQQRVAVARAIVRNPSIIIADEPTGNLDPDNSWSIMKLLVEINGLGATVVVSTHAKSLVNAMKKRVIAIEKGNVVRDEERGTYGYET